MRKISGIPRKTASPATVRPGELVALVFPLAALALAFWVLYAFFIGSRAGQRIDDTALVAAMHFMSADAARRPALAFLDSLPVMAAALAVLALVAAGIRSRHIVPPVIAGASMGAAMLSSQLLKHRILERPNHGISEATMNSFPSGHTTAAAAAMFTVLLIAPPVLRPWVAVCGGGFAAIAGASTLLMGWHRPSDVLAAYLVAAFWAIMGAVGLAIWARMSGASGPVASPIGPSARVLLRGVTLLGCIGTVAGTAALLGLPARGPVAGSETTQLLFLAGALVLLLSVAMLLSIALQWMLIRYRVDTGVRLGPDRGMK